MKKIILFLSFAVLAVFYSPVLAERKTISLPEEIESLIVDAKVVRYDNFEDPQKSDWELESSSKIENGILSLKGVPNWEGYVKTKRKVNANRGFILSYKYSMGSDFAIYLDHGNWGTETYKRFGVSPVQLRTNIYQGQQGLGWKYLPTNFYAKADTWYTILLAVADGGEFLAVIWEKDNPENAARYHEAIPAWEEISWNIFLSANTGEIEIDNFRLLSFSTFK